MFDILFVRTFLIVGGMLAISAVTSRINKDFESGKEFWLNILGTFGLLFAIAFFADIYPLNLLLLATFSALMGWQIGPTIAYLGKRFQMRKYFKSRGVSLEKGHKFTEEQKIEFEQSPDTDKYIHDWHNIVFQTIFATALATFATAGVVFLTSIDFSFLGGFLFISLFILIVMGLLNIFVFRSHVFSIVRAYVGSVIFTLYLIYDFQRLEKMAGDDTWSTAIDISVNLYLDIINLFVNLLEIFAEFE